MTNRICVTEGCGSTLGPMVRSNTRCRKCKDREIQEVRTVKREQRARVATINGKVLLHSCLSDGVHDAAIRNCLCRKLISASVARELIKTGRVIDFVTRKEIFSGGPVVETSRLQRPPISSLGQRIAIQRKSEELDHQDIARMKAIAEDDKNQRAEEQRCKIDLEHEIAVEEQAKLVKVYSDEEWFAIEREFALHRGFCDGIGHDERTLGSIGRNVGSKRAAPTDEEETEEMEEQFEEAA